MIRDLFQYIRIIPPLISKCIFCTVAKKPLVHRIIQIEVLIKLNVIKLNGSSERQNLNCRRNESADLILINNSF